MSTTDHTESSATGIGVPIPEPSRAFSVLLLDELYDVVTKKGQLFPNVNDLIIDYVGNCMLRCTAVDYTALTYTLTLWKPTAVYNTDNYIGACAPHLADALKVYVDTSIYPSTLRVDARLRFGGSDMDSIKIFRGRNASATGEVISAYIKDSTIQSENIPLELVSGSLAEKVAVTARCKGSVTNGELVTIVAYSDTNEVVAVALANIVITNLVMAADAPSRQMYDIKLRSPFILPGDERTLVLPINIPLDDIPLSVDVIYSDGTRNITLDGTRAKLDGLRSSGAVDAFYLSSVAGQSLDLLLSYKLASNETYVGDDVVDGVILRDYHATTLDVDGAYSLKLFVVPTWVNSASGYRLNYYLYDLTRDAVYNATPNVKMGVNAGVFDPTLYGVKQHLVATVDVSKVSAAYSAHIHSQSFTITLLNEGSIKAPNFLLEYDHSSQGYGDDVFIKFYYDNVTYWTVDLRAGCASKAEWLAKMYRRIYPLYDRRTESAPPEPIHFELVTKTKSYLFTVDQWVNPVHVDFQVNESEPLIIKWIQRTPTDDLCLGMSSALAHQSPAA